MSLSGEGSLTGMSALQWSALAIVLAGYALAARQAWRAR
jgi:hypothetical protein